MAVGLRGKPRIAVVLRSKDGMAAGGLTLAAVSFARCGGGGGSFLILGDGLRNNYGKA
jgi:hypothetical protein